MLTAQNKDKEEEKKHEKGKKKSHSGNKEMAKQGADEPSVDQMAKSSSGPGTSISASGTESTLALLASSPPIRGEDAGRTGDAAALKPVQDADTVDEHDVFGEFTQAGDFVVADKGMAEGGGSSDKATNAKVDDNEDVQAASKEEGDVVDESGEGIKNNAKENHVEVEFQEEAAEAGGQGEHLDFGSNIVEVSHYLRQC